MKEMLKCDSWYKFLISVWTVKQQTSWKSGFWWFNFSHSCSETTYLHQILYTFLKERRRFVAQQANKAVKRDVFFHIVMGKNKQEHIQYIFHVSMLCRTWCSHVSLKLSCMISSCMSVMFILSFVLADQHVLLILFSSFSAKCYQYINPTVTDVLKNHVWNRL